MSCWRAARRAFVVASALATWAASAQAHLMVAQKGTLNFSGDGAYLLLSLPVSALRRVDENGDGLLNAHELQTHRAAIEQQVRAAVQLRRGGRALELQGLLLNLAPADHRPGHPAVHTAPHAHQHPNTLPGAAATSQLVVMGRFALTGDADPAAGLHVPASAYRFRLGLFGRTPAERRFDMVFTLRVTAAQRPTRSQSLRFTPVGSEQALFPVTASR